ncbi:MAG: hypothetical protein US53_C0027G0017 [Candidatus Woesebacteria bacterium GW2011_GWA1_37_7]|uniref:Nucleotidyl transferase domain-containing protein n=1 Tax=Candidatus Woesebacteria bacterium GW2011_GWA1_37_7 TaxID=1618545 RepID=A0A0G0H4T6_9BACT|nr:MAG: hypothetical protein US53_C0027G0017 [Candidatus Woesebacteria bacterium GW2011_GWA1_37_7]
MAGKGKRTLPLGNFKPFIKIAGKEMLSWFISSIKHSVKERDTFLLITLSGNYKRYDFIKVTKKIFQDNRLNNKLEYYEIPTTPRGTSETVLLSKNLINRLSKVMVIYPDQYTDFDLSSVKNGYGYLGVCVNFGNKSGFVQIENGKVIRFVEKTNISNIASSGFYLFPSGKDLIYGIRKQIESSDSLNGEFYLGPSINFLIRKGIKVFPIEVKAKYNLGNPEDIAYFAKNCVDKFS